MSYKIGGGNGATITSADSEITGRIKMIGNVDFEIGEEEVSALDSVGFAEFIAQELATMSDTEIELYLNTKQNIELDPDAADATAQIRLGRNELWTIAFPQRSDESAGADFAAWAHIKKIGLPQIVNNTTLMLKLTLKWTNRDDSNEGALPVFTKATASV